MFAAVRFGRVPKREKAKILAGMQSVYARLAERALPAELTDDAQLMNAVVRAHMDTCDFTRDKVQVLMAAAHRQPDYTACPPTLVRAALSFSRYDAFHCFIHRYFYLPYVAHVIHLIVHSFYYCIYIIFDVSFIIYRCHCICIILYA